MRLRVEVLALAVVLAGFALFLTVEPPIVGGFVVAAGAELMVLGRFITPSTPTPPRGTTQRR